MREQIDELFSREMTRKEFLQHVGSGILILLGISGMLRALTQPKGRSQGYGHSAYGGIRR